MLFCLPTKTFVSNGFARVFDNYQCSYFPAQPRKRCIPNGFVRVFHNCSRMFPSCRRKSRDPVGSNDLHWFSNGFLMIPPWIPGFAQATRGFVFSAYCSERWFSNGFARFSVNCSRSCFLPRLKRCFSIGFIRIPGFRVFAYL